MGKQPVIILHGWGLSSGKFQLLAQLFDRKKYKVFVPDLPGFGKSVMPTKALALKDYADFLYVFVNNNHIDKPILIGHSFGGRVALKYQLLYPRATKMLVLTGTPGFTPVPRRRLIFFITIAKIGKFISSAPPFSFFEDRVRSWYYYVVGARDFYRAKGVMRETFKIIVQEDLMPCLRKVMVPCVLAWGANDRITPLWIAKKMKEIIPQANIVVIPDADHGVSYKQPEIFFNAIRKFL
ncbi:MAG TPA: alpha/beta hydrolase [Patescibacteria group bacterium]|jgi:pimeloyl-ACP methyl ester carboxylesterase|nr:alpha/beta hydrolase [Patescibacteria group bacterium]